LATSDEPAALGVTINGLFFMAQRNRFILYRNPDGITRVMTDSSGRFLLLFFNDQASLYRNPAAGPLFFSIKILEVAGALEVDTSNRLVVTLKNDSRVAIHRLRGELRGEDKIDSCRIDELFVPAVQPGKTFTLEVSLRARIAGDAVPLMMKLFPEDEGGPSCAPVEIKFNVVSHPRGSGPIG
jgi:hypothetical protein